MNELIYLKNGGNIGLGQVSDPIRDTSLIFNLDAGNTSSYPGTGNYWLDTSYRNVASISGATYGGSGTSGYLTFDGSNDYALISGSTYLALNTLTINVWLKCSNYSQTGYIFQKTSNGSTRQYEIHLNSNNNFYFNAEGLSTVSHLVSLTTLTEFNGGGSDKWNMFSVTFDGTYVKIYGNGILGYTSSSLTGTINNNTTGNAIIGAYGGGAWSPGGWYLNGSIGNVSIYNRALSDGEVLQNYNGYRSRYNASTQYNDTNVQIFQQYVVNANTVAYYQFNNNLIDSGSNGYNGTSGSTTSYDTGILQSNSIKLTGTTSYITYGNKVVPSGAKTIAFWYKNSDTPDYSCLLSNNNIFGVSSGTTIYVQANKYWVFQVRSGSNTFEINSGTANALNVWQHYVVTWDGTTNANGIKNYLNGAIVQQGTSTFTEINNSTYNMRIGNSQSDSIRYLRGWVDEMIIENRAWSATEVLDYYEKIKLHL